jgi:hypothetical protein
MCASCSSLLDGMDDSVPPQPDPGQGEVGGEAEPGAAGESEEPDSKEHIIAAGAVKKS